MISTTDFAEYIQSRIAEHEAAIATYKAALALELAKSPTAPAVRSEENQRDKPKGGFPDSHPKGDAAKRASPGFATKGSIRDGSIRKRLLVALASGRKPVQQGEIATLLGATYASVSSEVQRAVKAGQVRRVGRGEYQITERGVADAGPLESETPPLKAE